MIRTKRLAIVVVAVIGLQAPQGAWGVDPTDLSAFMRAKLKYSQLIVEGLTTEDYDSLVRHGQEMALLSQAANWNVLQTDDYLHHSIGFRRAANALTQAAKEKNLEGATLAYVDMTMKCVRCHQYVRGVRTAALPRRPLRAVR